LACWSHDVGDRAESTDTAGTVVSQRTRVRWRVRSLVLAVAVATSAGGTAQSQAIPAEVPRARRAFPDTSTTIAILADQLPGRMTPEQLRFVSQRFVGSQKLTLDISRALRQLNPAFLVLHYRLGMWQSAEGVRYIVNGVDWGNDFAEVSGHEEWFWHNQKGQRVASTIDGKLLMNLGQEDLAKYWADSMIAQARACECDAVFADSSSPALLTLEASASEPRFATTGAKDARLPELQGRSFVDAWTAFMTGLEAAVSAGGLVLIPNVGSLITTWDPTPYEVTSGAFVEGFTSPAYALDDWKASVNRMLGMVKRDKILVLQNYLRSVDDRERRRYFLANYLLVKGRRTYLEYFAQSPLEWYPEWDVDLGSALSVPNTVEELADGGVYRRHFERGVVIVNPGDTPATVTFDTPLQRLEFNDGGPLPASGATSRPRTAEVTTIEIPARSAEVLLK
jgi:hypothetical protein